MIHVEITKKISKVFLLRGVDLIDVTLACEDANSKLVEIVTIAHVDAEDHVGNSL